MYRKTTLENGLRVISTTLPHVRSLSLTVVVGAGSRHESLDRSGLAHFVEHMLFKGTERRPTAKEIAEAIEGVGGVFNAETDKETTTYWVKVAAAHWPVALDIVSDVLRRSRFAPDELERERRVIIEELHMVADTPGELVNVLIDEVLWEGHPLGRDVAGTPETVARLTRDDLLAFVRTFYTPGNLIVAVAGPLDHAQIVQDIAVALGDWPPGDPPGWQPFEGAQPGPRVRVIYRKTEQAHFCLGFPGLAYTHPQRYALGLLNIILGEAMSSRLFLELRERRGLAYEVHSSVHHYRDTGALVIYAGVDPRRIEEAIQVVREQTLALRAGPDPAELARAKEYLKGRLLLSLEDTRNLALWLGGQELRYGRVLSVEEVLAQIDRQSPDDLRAVAEAVLRPERQNLAVVGPFRGPERFQRLLLA